MIDLALLQLLLVLIGWLDRRERDAIAYLREENRGCDGSWLDDA